MLVIHSEDRKSCEEVWVELNKRYQQCCIDEEYAGRGNPWSIRRESFSRPVAFHCREETAPTSPDSIGPRVALPSQTPLPRLRRGTISGLTPANRSRLLPISFPEVSGLHDNSCR
jgi:hypothetical protein